MNKELMMNLLLEDRFTKAEAERMIKENRVIIYDNIDNYLSELNAEKYEDDDDITLDMIKNGEIADVSYIVYEGNEYILVRMN